MNFLINIMGMSNYKLKWKGKTIPKYCKEMGITRKGIYKISNIVFECKDGKFVTFISIIGGPSNHYAPLSHFQNVE